MLKKVYISKDQSIAIDEAREDFCDLKVLHCDSLSFNDFVGCHQPSIFASKLICFVGVEKFHADELLKLLDNRIPVDVIWCFTSLAKNQKVYKKLATTSNIEECKHVVKSYEKRKFITSLVGNKLPSKVIDELVISLPDSVAVIKNEIKNILKAAEHSDIINVASYSSETDVFEFIDSLLNNDVVNAYLYAQKVSTEFNQFGFSALLLKKLKFYLLLSQGNDKQALSVWNLPPYLLVKEKNTAKAIGFVKLTKLFEHVYKNFQHEYMGSKPAFCKLSETVLYFNRIL